MVRKSLQKICFTVIICLSLCHAGLAQESSQDDLRYDLTPNTAAQVEKIISKNQNTDPVFDESGLTLLAAVGYGLSNNTDILQARLNLDASKANILATEGTFDPEITVSADTSRNKSPFNETAAQSLGYETSDSLSDSANIGIGKTFSTGTRIAANASLSRFADRRADDPDANTSTLSLSFNQPLLRGFGEDAVEGDRKIAALDAQARQAETVHSITNNANRIAQDFWNYADAAESLAVIETSMARLQGLQEEFTQLSAKGLYDAGDKGVIDARLSDMQSSKLASEDQYRSARAALGLSMGIDISAREKIPRPLYTLYRPTPLEKQTYERFLKHAQNTRNDIIAEHLSAEQEEIRVHQAENGTLPDLSVVGSVGKERAGSGQDLGDTLNTLTQGNSANSWSVGVALSMPLYNDSAHGKLQTQQASLLSQKLRQHDLERSLTFTIAENYESLESARTQITQSETNFGNYLELYRKQLSDFRAGKASLYDFLQTEQDLTNAEASLASLLIRYYAQLANFRNETNTLISQATPESVQFEEKRFLSTDYSEGD